jgi:hypothetical protein
MDIYPQYIHVDEHISDHISCHILHDSDWIFDIATVTYLNEQHKSNDSRSTSRSDRCVTLDGRAWKAEEE